jgi:putative FmdB family regulatory protein
MPIYEFACTQCDHRWDELLKISDPDPAACPRCTKASVQRYVSAAAFRLKGAGWYETDFKKDGDTKRHLAGDAASDSNTESAKAGDGKASEGKAAESKSADSTTTPQPSAEKSSASTSSTSTPATSPAPSSAKPE